MLKKILLSVCVLIASCSFLGAAERTLSIIKPDAVKANQIGEIIARFEANQLRVAAMKMKQMTKQEAMDFYAEHKERPFYANLTNFMSSGPVVVMVLEGDHAIKKNREIMGATDPTQALKGTIRKDFAKSKEQNAVHGSDSPQSAEREIHFFFKPGEIQNRF